MQLFYTNIVCVSFCVLLLVFVVYAGLSLAGTQNHTTSCVVLCAWLSNYALPPSFMHILRDLFVLHIFFFPADVFAHSSMLVLMRHLLQVVGVVDLWQPCFREIQEVLPSLCLQQDYASQVDLKTVQLTDHILCELLTQRYKILFCLVVLECIY